MEFQDPQMEALKHIKPDFKARFCGDIPLHSPCLGRVYGIPTSKKKWFLKSPLINVLAQPKTISKSPRFVCGVGRSNHWPHLFVKFLLLRLHKIRDCWYWWFRPNSKIGYIRVNHRMRIKGFKFKRPYYICNIIYIYLLCRCWDRYWYMLFY